MRDSLLSYRGVNFWKAFVGLAGDIKAFLDCGFCGFREKSKFVKLKLVAC